MKKVVFPIALAIILLLSACGVVALGDKNNPIDVSYALENIKGFHGKEVYINCYPVAYYFYRSFTGAKSYIVFFSDSASDYCGELDALEDAQDSWLEVHIHEDDALWKGIEKVFKNGEESYKLVLVFKGKKDSTFGYYLDFVEWYS